MKATRTPNPSRILDDDDAPRTPSFASWVGGSTVSRSESTSTCIAVGGKDDEGGRRLCAHM